MRQRKYRAWDKKNNCWFKPTYEANKGDLEELLIGLNGRLSLRTMEGMADESVFFGRFEVTEYIGLKDKNGIEIYESDVVSWPTGNISAGKEAVEWDEEYAGFTPFCSQIFSAADSYSEWYLPPVEVIGNIYESPHLLTGTAADDGRQP